MKEEEIRERLARGFADAVKIAVDRFPNDYDAALRYARELVNEEGA